MASNFIKEKFFVLDSNNYKDFKTKLYGYYFDEQGNLITQSNFEKFDENAHGAYIFVENNNGKITIKQDFNGSYGLYLFQKDNYFAVSNSFLYLVEYLKSKFELTYNYDYANTFIVCGLCSEVYEKTFINEITALSRDTEIHIYDNIIQLLNIDYKEYSISIDSKEGIDTLDKWFFKYTSIIRNIKVKSNLLSCDLSGGFDSRCCFALFLAANINLDEVKINSSTDGLHCHPEDLKIATDIANHFKFPLNKNFSQNNNKTYTFKDLKTAIDVSFYTKLGFHKEMYFKTGIRNVIHYSFMGAEGEFLRGDPIITKQQYIGKYSRSKLFGKTYVESIDKVLQDTFFNLKNKFKIENENFISMFCCREGQSKNHFGKSRVGNYISNVLSFNPLSDKIIRKINFNNQNCSDSKLLITVLLDRYCPDLLNFEVEGGRKFEPETIEYAKKINAKFPFTNPYTTKISLDKTKEDNTILELSSAEKNAIDENSKISATDCNNYLYYLFCSKGFKDLFESHFSKTVYSYIQKHVITNNYFPLRHVYSAIAAVKFLIDVQQSKINNKNITSSLDSLEYLCNISKFDDEFDLSEFNDNFKCRIDIKNVGTENCEVEIVGISGVTYPEWFKNKNGVGAVVSTYIGNKNLEIICKGNGWLYIWLRGIDKRNNENKRIPMYICADELKINEHTIFNEPKIVWHDDSYLYKMPVTDGQKVKIFVKFSPAFYKK